jgi:tRNA nucleotidyltransferase/poly(A) polymerase
MQAQQVGLYLVGGAVRHFLTYQQLPADLDFAIVNGAAAGLAPALAQALDATLVPLHEDFGMYRVVVPSVMRQGQPLTLDLCDALNNNLEDDLARRDLTLNAIAIDMHTGRFIDPHHGRRDLAAGVIRMVHPRNLEDDPLRLLRVFRCYAYVQAGRIAPETMGTVSALKGRLWKVAPERLREEWFKLLDITPCYGALLEMSASGLLEALLPELTATRSVPPNTHHHLWLLDHTLALVHEAEQLWPTLPASVQQHFQQKIGGVRRWALLKMACLLHDIGKPATMAISANGRTTFYGHEQRGETMTQTLCQRLKTGHDVSVYLQHLVRWHLYPCQFGPQSPRKSVLRYFRRMGDFTHDVTVLALADRLATRGPAISPEDIACAEANHRWLMQALEEEAPVLHQPRLVNGHDVMAVLGLPPGPALQPILEATLEAQQLGVFDTPEGGRAWLATQAHALLAESETIARSHNQGR